MSFEATFTGPSFIDYADNLNDVAAQLKDVEPFLVGLEEAWVESRKELFRTGGDGEWPDYLPSEAGYVGYKKALKAGLELLKFDKDPNSKRLYKSLILPGHPDFLFEVNPSSIRMGTSVPYATNHLTGGSTPRWGGVRFPVRNFLLSGDFDSRVQERLDVLTQDIADDISNNTSRSIFSETT